MDDNPQSLADEMLEHARQEAEVIEDQREEIMRAFIAQHGFDPDHAMQVTSGPNGQHTWQIVHFSDEDVNKVRRTLLIARVSHEPLTLWQQCCVFLANWKWPK